MFTGSCCSLALHYIRQKLQNHALEYFYEQVHRFVTSKISLYNNQINFWQTTKRTIIISNNRNFLIANCKLPIPGANYTMGAKVLIS